jgi:hypothetical protein
MAVFIVIFCACGLVFLIYVIGQGQQRNLNAVKSNVYEIRASKVDMYEYDIVQSDLSVKEGFTAFRSAVLKNHISYYEYRMMCEKDSGYQNLYKKVDSLPSDNGGFEYDLTKGYEIDLELVATLEMEGVAFS